MMTPRSFLQFCLLALVLATPFAFAQSPSPPARAAADTAAAKPVTAPAPPAAPPSPSSGIRNKISAGDLLSAESILEVFRDKYGENSQYLAGLSWLARGALLLGERDKAKSYAADVRARCDRKLAAGDTLDRDRDFETALGAAIEVDAQLIERAQGQGPAAAYVRAEIPKIPGPASLRSRLYKRLNLLTLVGQKAPPLALEDRLGESPPALSGQPTVLFLWAEWCGDCRAQAASLGKARRRFEKDGVRLVALTRYYDPDSLRVREKARVDSVWKADYADLAGVPVAFSTASMERYGGSSTPTFVFVDRTGLVRRYTPTRLTEAELDRTLTALVK
jgi:thiol-disulfide isomerase/thioredoxin